MPEQVEQVITAQRFTVLKRGCFGFNPGSKIYPFINGRRLAPLAMGLSKELITRIDYILTDFILWIHPFPAVLLIRISQLEIQHHGDGKIRRAQTSSLGYGGNGFGTCKLPSSLQLRRAN